MFPARLRALLLVPVAVIGLGGCATLGGHGYGGVDLGRGYHDYRPHHGSGWHGDRYRYRDGRHDRYDRRDWHRDRHDRRDHRRGRP